MHNSLLSLCNPGTESGPDLAEAGAHGAVPAQLDAALLPEHAGHLAPGPGAQGVNIAPDPQLLAFLLK